MNIPQNVGPNESYSEHHHRYSVKKHLVKNRLKATLAPKSGESDMFFEKKSRN